jgi:putative transcriptional regulator
MRLKIKEVRRNRKISQTQLSNISGVARGYLSELESGKYNNPGICVLCKLKCALGCTLDELVDCEEDE